VCGRSEAAPTLPSPGRPDSRVNQDAAFLFGLPQQEHCSRPMPFTYSGFQANIGSGFNHATPVGAPSGDTTDHAYSYLMRGQGSPAQFRMNDTNTTDNNGVLRVVLRPATAQDCGDNADCLNGIPAASQGVAAAAPSATTIPLPKKSCVSRRAFRIRVVSRRKSDPVTAATIRLSSTNKRFKTRTRRLNGRKRVTAGISLRGLPAGTYRVLITAKTKKGRVLVGRRTYRTCTVKKKGSRPPL